jgi:hypothetical protein
VESSVVSLDCCQRPFFQGIWGADLHKTPGKPQVAIFEGHDRIVHRDITPRNILAGTDGTWKLTDFGLAKLIKAPTTVTHTGEVRGTPLYMAPERFGARASPDVRSDIYALGAVLYEALTGGPPFRGASIADVVYQVLNAEPVALRTQRREVPRDLETICSKCLNKNPQHRYATARELADDLERYLNGEPIQARPVSAAERLIRWCGRNPGLAGALGAAALFLLLGTVISSLFGLHALAAAQRADREAGIAREAKLESDRRYYASEMKLAGLEAEAGQMGLVRQRLREQEPKGAADPDLRGFEWYYLQRLCQLDLRTLTGHKSAVTAVAYSPDGLRQR